MFCVFTGTNDQKFVVLLPTISFIVKMLCLYQNLRDLYFIILQFQATSNGKT